MLEVFNEIAPSKNVFAGFLADKWKLDGKINRLNCVNKF